MLSRVENELLCRVGPGTPMGELMRQYWIPCLPSSEFPEPDGEIKRMMLLGESFVMFRDSEGTIGATVEACSRVLQRAGARQVDVLTLARVVRPAV